MSDLPPGQATDLPPDVPVVAARRSVWDRISIIWLVPVAALVVALGIAWQSYASRGPLIEITFIDASGITAGQTELRFRDVAVGLVEGLSFSPEFDRVIVEVRLNPDVVDFVDGDATFWVVRPQVSAEGITGLETVLSGVYIKGQWDIQPGGLVRAFDGLADAPLMSADEQGTVVLLRSTTGGLQGNVPLLYKGVEVGRVGPAQVTEDGFAVEAEALILAPWDALVTEATRFYNVSGFSLSLGTGGASVNFESISTLLVGGISFETWVSGAPLARNGAPYVVYSDSDTARSSVFNRLDGQPLYLSAIFEGNVTGLNLGAPVEIDGLRIGEVSGMTGISDRAEFGDGRVRLLTQLTIQPARLGFDEEEGPQQAMALMQELVGEGLRARLVTGSILNGSLKVQLTNFAEIAPGSIDLDAAPYPSLPVAPSEIADLQATAQGTLDRIDALPIEDLMASATAFLDGAAQLVANPDTQAVPGEVRAAVASVATVVSAPEIQAIPARVEEVLAELEATLAEARALVAALNEADAAGRVLALVDTAGTTLEGAQVSIAALPDLIARIDAVAAQAAEMRLGDIGLEAQALLAEARALVAAPALQALPDQVSGAVAGVEGLVGDIRSSGVIEQASDAIAGISEAASGLPALVTEAQSVLARIDAATVGLPALIDAAGQVAQNLSQADLDGLVAQARTLFGRIGDFLASDDLLATPGALNALLAEATAIAGELREAGVASSLTGTLATIEQAADQIATATEGLPPLVEQARGVLSTANTALAGLSDLGQTMRDVNTALREISRAAGAVASLAQRIERAPNSLIFGN